jgi:hypothetical protein
MLGFAKEERNFNKIFKPIVVDNNERVLNILNDVSVRLDILTSTVNNILILPNAKSESNISTSKSDNDLENVESRKSKEIYEVTEYLPEYRGKEYEEYVGKDSITALQQDGFYMKIELLNMVDGPCAYQKFYPFGKINKINEYNKNLNNFRDQYVKLVDKNDNEYNGKFHSNDLSITLDGASFDKLLQEDFPIALMCTVSDW